jgi:2-polyprenyl-6-methoxyphenol hydroxylase-like FAD-dependent oxidoreductase
VTHALIIGGGIAGAVTAMALKKAGITATVYEAYPVGADDIGAFLTIMNNGVDALRAIDAHHTVIENSFPANTIEFYSAGGEHHGSQVIGDGADVNGPRTLTRATLYRALHDEAAHRGIQLAHGKRLMDATTEPDGRVVASFADGTRAEGNLLIGADGLHSATRSIIDPDAPGPRYAGLNVAYGYAHDSSLPAAANSYRMIEGSQGFFGYTTAPDGETWWFARLAGPELTKSQIADTSPEQVKQRLADTFANDDTPASRIVHATGDTIFMSNAYDVPATPVWHAGSMVLVGDAAHAASPAAGQGASMALEDSVILAKCLRDVPDIQQAFRSYERLRRGRVERLVAASAAQGTRATRSESREWLYRHHINWDTRENPDTDTAA